MSSIDKLLSDAQDMCRAGNFEPAERLYLNALEQAPDNGQIHYMLGCLLAQAGWPAEAVAELETACRLTPRSAGARMALGELFLMLGRWEEAAAALTIAVELVPDFAPGRINLGLALAFSGRAAEAEALLNSLLEADPVNVEAHGNLACILNGQKRYAEAEVHARIAVDLAPEHAAARRYLAGALVGLGRWDEGAPALLRAIELLPDLPEIHLDLIEAYRRQKRCEEAEQAARNAARLKPNDGRILHALGLTLNDLHRWDEAVEMLTRALDILPDFVAVRLHLGTALANSGRFGEAEAQLNTYLAADPGNAEANANLAYVLNARRRYEKGEAQARIAVDIDPEHSLAWNILGVSLHGQGRAPESVESFRQALAICPSNLTYLYWYWNALLVSGDYARGFPVYDRWKRESRFKYREFPRPRWDGEPMPGRTLLVYSDHGFGDAFQMLRFLPEVKRRSQADILFEGPPELLPLVANDPSVSAVVTYHSDERPPEGCYDAVVGLTSLPGLLCTSVHDLPHAVPYVYPSADRVQAWRDRLDEWQGFRIGICWTGDSKNPTNAFRSCRLADFAGIASIPGVQLFSLQVGYGSEQALAPPLGMSPVDLGPQLTDFGETAAALMNLDAVVAVETSTAHLAGALGRPTIVPLTSVSWWVWMVGREDSPWYPTIRLVRQTKRDDWGAVFTRIEQEIRSLFAQL